MIFLSKNILFLKKFGLTAYKIEKETGIPQSTISYIIHSKNNNIELKTLEKLFYYYKKNRVFNSSNVNLLMSKV